MGAGWGRDLNKRSVSTPGVVALVCDPITQQAEARGGSQGPQPGLLWAQGQPRRYIVSFKNTKTKSNHTKKPQYTPWFHFTSYRTELPGSRRMVSLLHSLLFPTPRECWERQSKERDCSIYRTLIQCAQFFSKNHKILENTSTSFWVWDLSQAFQC